MLPWLLEIPMTRLWQFEVRGLYEAHGGSEHLLCALPLKQLALEMFVTK